MVAVERKAPITAATSEPLGVEIPTPFVQGLAALDQDLRPQFVAAVRVASANFPSREQIADGVVGEEDHTRICDFPDSYVGPAVEWARRIDPQFRVPERGLGEEDGPPTEAERQFYIFFSATYLLSREQAQGIVNSLPQVERTPMPLPPVAA